VTVQKNRRPLFSPTAGELSITNFRFVVESKYLSTGRLIDAILACTYRRERVQALADERGAGSAARVGMGGGSFAHMQAANPRQINQKEQTPWQT
jgi:hypothetical protein